MYQTTSIQLGYQIYNSCLEHVEDFRITHEQSRKEHPGLVKQASDFNHDELLIAFIWAIFDLLNYRNYNFEKVIEYLFDSYIISHGLNTEEAAEKMRFLEKRFNEYKKLFDDVIKADYNYMPLASEMAKNITGEYDLIFGTLIAISIQDFTIMWGKLLKETEINVDCGDLDLSEDLIESYKQEIQMAHYNRGAEYGESGMYQESIWAYKNAIQIKPDFVDAHNNLGTTYLKLGMHKESIEAFNQAIRIKPDYQAAHYNLGNAYVKLGMHKEAIEAFKQAIRIKPDDAEAHNNLGIAYLLIDDKGSAIDEYKILKELDTEKANELFNLIYK